MFYNHNTTLIYGLFPLIWTNQNDKGFCCFFQKKSPKDKMVMIMKRISLKSKKKTKKKKNIYQVVWKIIELKHDKTYKITCIQQRLISCAA